MFKPFLFFVFFFGSKELETFGLQSYLDNV